MKKFLMLFLSMAFLAAANGMAQPAPRIDDSDLYHGRAFGLQNFSLQMEGRQEDGSIVFSAQRLLEKSPIWEGQALRPRPLSQESAAIFGVFTLTDVKGRIWPARFARAVLMGKDGIYAESDVDSQGRWRLEPPSQLGGRLHVRFRLDNNFWILQKPGSPPSSYEWEGPAVELPLAGPFDAGVWRLEPGTVNSEAGRLHRTLVEAVEFFEKNEIPIPWWKTVKIFWPSDGNYYMPFTHTVNLTDAHAWDVTLHELGHSIVATALRAAQGGGEHYIDRCYDVDLAFSEGFPTFFAGAAHLDPSDPDAKFEYLVPRRHPVRIENVPEDVCRGETNEWRVAAAFWDLTDTHNDGADIFYLSQKRLWAALRQNRFSGIRGGWGLIRKNLEASEIGPASASLRQNTMDFSPSALTHSTPLSAMASGNRTMSVLVDLRRRAGRGSHITVQSLP